MSIRGLSQPCPKCGDDGPFFLAKHHWGCGVFAKGYACGVCGEYWDARESDRADHPDEFEGWPGKCVCEARRKGERP